MSRTRYVAAIVVLATLLVPALAHADTQTDLYSYTGGKVGFTVPAGVTKLHVRVHGGGGGNGGKLHSGGANGSSGGGGGVATGTFTVAPGQKVDVVVGQRGTPGHDYNGAECLNPFRPSTPSANGGESPGSSPSMKGGRGGNNDGPCTGQGGGGGGASAVYLGSTLIAVGGGGGGGGGAGGIVGYHGGNGGDGNGNGGSWGVGPGNLFPGGGGEHDSTEGQSAAFAPSLTSNGGCGAGGGGYPNAGRAAMNGDYCRGTAGASGASGGGGGKSWVSGFISGGRTFADNSNSNAHGGVAITYGLTSTSVTTAESPTAPGATATFTATVTSGGGRARDGAISFFAKGAPIAGCQDLEPDWDGQATCATTALTAGDNAIVAKYSGGAIYSASEGTVNHVVRVPVETSMSISGQARVDAGVPTRFYAYVGVKKFADIPMFTGQGTISFYIDGVAAPCGPQTLINYVSVAWYVWCDVTIATPGTHSVTASYTGMPGVGGSSTQMNQVVLGPAATLSMTPADATINLGGAQGFTIHAFDVNGNWLGEVTGSATITGPNCSGHVCTPTAIGSHTVTAKYGNATGSTQLHVRSVPSAPQNVVATPAVTTASVAFEEPASTGNSPITQYAVTATDQGDGSTRTATGAGSPISVEGLATGRRYRFAVTATNAAGTGPAGTSEIVRTALPFDLGLTASAPATTERGVAFDVALRVRNDGPQTAPDAALSLALPAGFAAVDPPSTCTATSSAVTCALGNVPSGADLAIPLKVRTTQRGAASFTATVTPAADLDPDDNTAATATTVADTAPPAVTIDTVPARTKGATLPFTGQAGTAAGDGGTVRLLVHAGTSATGAPIASPSVPVSNGTWAANIAGLASGAAYTVQSHQVDDAGNTGSSATRTFTVDRDAPAPTLDPVGSPTAAPVFGGTGGLATGDASTLTLWIYAGSASSGDAVVTRSVTRDALHGRWSASVTGLADGAYTAVVRQSDDLDNTGASLARPFVVDRTAPDVTLDALAARTGDSTPAFGGSGGRATGDAATVTVRVYPGAAASGTPVQTLTATRSSGTGRYAVDAATLADGTYTAQAAQGDHAQNTGTSAPTTFVVDTGRPAVTLDALAARTSTAPALAGAAGSATGDLAPVAVRIYAGGAASGEPVQTLSATRAGDRWTATPAALADGTYTVQAAQSDDVANTGTSAARTFVVDSRAPDVTLGAVAARTASDAPVLAGVAGTADGDQATVTLRVFAGTTAAGEPVRTLSATVDGTDGGFGLAVTPALPDGTYTARATQSDDLGHVGVSVDRTFTVDTTGPALTLTAVPARSTDTTPTFAGTSGTAPGDGATVTVVVRRGAELVRTLTTTRDADTGAYAVDASPALADGTYTAQATATDDLDNPGTSPVRTFTVDTTAPEVGLDAPAARTSADPVGFDGTGGRAAGDAETVTVTVYGGASATGDPVRTLTTTRTSTDGAFHTATRGLGDGTYTVQASQRDDLDHVGTSTARTFTVDRTAPLLSVAAIGRTGDDTPALGGVAGTATGDGAAVTVEILREDAIVQTRTATRDADTGAFGVDASPALADGTYLVRARQQDDLGHVTQTPGTPLTVDTAAPAVTLDAPAARMGDTTPTLTGTGGRATGDAGTVTLRVWSGAAASGEPRLALTASVDAAGRYQATTEALADGTYTVQSAQRDDLDHVGTSDAHTFVVDTTEPDVTLDAIAARTRDATPALTGTAGSGPGDGNAVTIRIFGGTGTSGDPVATVTATRTGTGAFATSAPELSDGTYTAVATQADDLDHTGTSGTRTFVVDTTAPTLTPTAIDARTRDTTPTFSGVAGTATGDDAHVAIVLSAGAGTSSPVAQRLQAAVDPATGAYAIDATALEDGTYTARATQSDDLGNATPAPPQVLTVDTTAPAIAIDAVDARTADTTPRLAGTAGTAVGDDATVTVRVYAGRAATGTPVQTLTATRAADGGRYGVDAAALGDGAYTATAAQSDDLGNDDVADPTTFVVDTTKPVVGLDAIGPRTGDATPALTGTAGTADGDDAAVTIRVHAGGDTTGAPEQTLTATRDADTGAYAVDAGELADGTYTAIAAQSDDVGNADASAARTFTVDTVAPKVTLDPIAARATDDTPRLAGAGGTALGDDASVTVRVYAGSTTSGTPVQTLTAPRDATTGAYAVDAAKLTDGTYTAIAAQSDDVDNGDHSDERTFVVDTTAPALVLDTPAARTGDATPTLAGTAGRATGDTAAVTVTIRRATPGAPGADAVVQTLTTTRDAGTGRFAVDAAALTDGTYTVRAAQDDDLGNAGASATETFTVDTVAPAVTLDALAARTGDSTPALEGIGGRAAGDARSVRVTIHRGTSIAGAVEQTVTTTRDDVTGRYRTSASPALADGTYTAVATQADDLDHTGSSAARTFVVDATRPTVTLDALVARTADRTPALTGTASRDEDDAPSVALTITPASGAATTVTAPVDAATGRYAVRAPRLADGAYTVRARQADGSGNVADSADRAVTIDATAPAVTLDAPAPRSDDTTPALAGTAASAPGDEDRVTVRVHRGTSTGGEAVQTLTATRGAGGRYAVEPAALPDGTYTAQTTQADDLGNAGASPARTFVIDTTRAAPPVTAGSASTSAADALTNLRIRLGADGTATVSGTVSGPGTIDVLETVHRMGKVARSSELRPGPNAVAFGTARLQVGKAGSVRLTVKPSKAGRAQLAARRAKGQHVAVNAYVTFTDRSGRAQRQTRRVSLAAEKGLAGTVLGVLDPSRLAVRIGGRRVTVTLLGITPRTSCAGATADALREVLGTARSVAVIPDARHRVARTATRMTAYVMAGKRDLGHALLAAGVARVPDGVAFLRRPAYTETAAAASCPAP